jgi:hypothetical protein
MAYAVLRRPVHRRRAAYANALRGITRRAGKPEAFNLTVTIAFLALIAERMAAGTADDFAAFARAHPDLFAKDVLARWYRPEQLASPLARRVFLLPDPLA